MYYDERTCTYLHRQKENAFMPNLFLQREFDLNELFYLLMDLIEEKLREKKESNSDDYFEFGENFESRNVLKNPFIPVRCWVKSRKKEGQRLRFNKICFN